MEMLILLVAALIAVAIIWKVLKGIIKTIGLVIVMAVVAYVTLFSGALG